MLTLVVISFIAGFLTILAPCSLPLLPVILGSSASDSSRKWKPYIIVASLIVSIVIFTLIIRASAGLLDIPVEFWTQASGWLLVLIGLAIIFPIAWAKISHNLGAEKGANTWLARATQKKGVVGDILTGVALAPVFSTCSPTYLIILAAILPESFLTGTFLLLVFVLGLAVVMLPIALIGQKFVSKLSFAADPRGWFKKVLGILILLVGVAFITGYDKKIETWALENGLNYSFIEEGLLEKNEVDSTVDLDLKKRN